MRATTRPGRRAGPDTVWAIPLILIGVLAILLPLLGGVAVELSVGSLMILGGVAHIVIGFQPGAAGNIAWKLLIGGFYLIVGGYLLFNPQGGLVPLALLVAALFFAEATLELILYLQTRATLGSGWMLFDGILTLLLALVLGLTGASSPLWALGFIAGISMLVSGISRLMLSKPGSVGEE